MKVTYFGHSSFQVEINGKKILFDPFISPNELAKDIAVDSLNPDYIFVTHGHEDHIADVESIAKRTGAKLVANYEVINWFAKKGIENNHPMGIGGTRDFDFGTVKCVNAVHSSSMPDGSYGGQSVGFVFLFIEDEVEKVMYYAGDTALHYDMNLIQDEFEYVDFAFLPVGDNFTMGMIDAEVAAHYVNADNVIPMHYDTFGFIKIEQEELKEIFEEFNLEIFKIGEQKELI